MPGRPAAVGTRARRSGASAARAADSVPVALELDVQRDLVAHRGDRGLHAEVRALDLADRVAAAAGLLVEGVLATLEALEEELDPVEFFRANRSTIVHIDSIGKIENYFGGKLHVKLLSRLNTEVIVSRLKNMSFRNWIAK